MFKMISDFVALMFLLLVLIIIIIMVFIFITAMRLYGGYADSDDKGHRGYSVDPQGVPFQLN